MRILNIDGRLCLATPDSAVDVETASGGQFPARVDEIYGVWDDFRRWVEHTAMTELPPAPVGRLGPPSPQPRQVFAIGLNYRQHAEEAGLGLPTTPMVFTKFPTSVGGPHDPILLPPGSVDFEAELVAVIGRRAEAVSEATAWQYVAGLTVGQDLSERDLQTRPPAPQQFSLAKSFPGFAPIGPALVTPDEFANPDDLEVGTLVNGEQMQKARTSDLIFPVPALVAYLSSVLPLLPGDLIFTGTPSGVGWARDPQRFLQPGDEVVTYVEGIGELRQRCVASPPEA